MHVSCVSVMFSLTQERCRDDLRLLKMQNVVELSPHPENLCVITSKLMGAYHYRDYDFMNQSGQLYTLCEYVGWHVGNSKVGFVVPIINRS